jgi:hypothetical protein
LRAAVSEVIRIDTGHNAGLKSWCDVPDLGTIAPTLGTSRKRRASLADTLFSKRSNVLALLFSIRKRVGNLTDVRANRDAQIFSECEDVGADRRPQTAPSLITQKGTAGTVKR